MITSGGKMILNLAVQSRELGKKSERKNLRKSGQIPAVIYSEGQPGINISVPANEFLKLYRKSIREVAVFNLTLNGNDLQAIVKSRQMHPVSREFLHVDFLELHKGKELSLSVPIKFIGTPASIKEGGILEITVREVEVSCLPRHIPEDIPLNIENLNLGDTIYIKDLNIENVTIKDSGNIAVVSIHSPKAEKTTEDEETTDTVVEETE